MNRKQLITLLVLVLILGGAGLLLRQRENASWTGAGRAKGNKVLGDFKINDVARISLKQGPATATLVKKNDHWTVAERNNYPANYSEISDFLIKAGDLKIVQTEKVGASQLGRFGLLAGQGTNVPLTVEFKDQTDKTIRSLLLGKKHMRKSDRNSPMGGEFGEEGFPDGRYVKSGADSGDVLVISDALANIESKPEQWLDKDFFKIEKVSSMAVDFPAVTNSWKLARETESAEWKLIDAKPGEQLDASKASSVANPLGSPSFTDVATDTRTEQLGLDKPTVVTVNTFDGLNYTLKVGTKTNDNYALTITLASQPKPERSPGKDEKPEDKDKLDKEFKEAQKKIDEKVTREKTFEKWAYLVPQWTFEPLLKDRAQLMVEKKEEPKKEVTGTNEPPKIETSTPIPAPVTPPKSQ
jgi:hypothetical protein